MKRRFFIAISTELELPGIDPLVDACHQNDIELDVTHDRISLGAPIGMVLGDGCHIAAFYFNDYEDRAQAVKAATEIAHVEDCDDSDCGYCATQFDEARRNAREEATA